MVLDDAPHPQALCTRCDRWQLATCKARHPSKAHTWLWHDRQHYQRRGRVCTNDTSRSRRSHWILSALRRGPGHNAWQCTALQRHGTLLTGLWQQGTVRPAHSSAAGGNGKMFVVCVDVQVLSEHVEQFVEA